MKPTKASCTSQCLNNALLPDNTSTAWREGYDYTITGSSLHCEGSGRCPVPATDVTYRWPNVIYGGTYYLRLSVIYDAKDQIFTLPFDDAAASMWNNGWLYSFGSWHMAIDYSRLNGNTFQVVAAAPGKVIYFGWDDWSGNTMILSHNVGNEIDIYRTIYMHLRNGPQADCNSAWTITVPALNAQQSTVYTNYLTSTGCPQNLPRNPFLGQWGTIQQVAANIVGQTVAAGTFLGFAGSTGPGGCGCMGGGMGPNTHLHIFFAHRDPGDNRWYLTDPYGIYSTKECGYPASVNGAITSECSRYPITWKGGIPSYS